MSLKENFVESNNQTLDGLIKKLMKGLTGIVDDGTYSFEANGAIVDDKSWNAWNWPQGVALYGLYKYGKKQGDSEAAEIISDWYRPYLQTVFVDKNVNSMAPILTLACLYEESGNPELIPHLEDWAKWSMETLSKTAYNGFQHDTFGVTNHQQLWDDTLMMSVLALAKIGILFDNADYMAEAERQFLVHCQFLMDKQTGLWYHGWTFAENHNFSNVFWARGNCWITIAIPEFISIMGERLSQSVKNYLIDVLNAQIDSLVKVQNAEGLWHTVLDDPSSYVEVSAGFGFVYGIEKGVSMGIVSRDRLVSSNRALEQLLSFITSEGQVKNVSAGTPMGETKQFYKDIPITDMPYGPSLAILALGEKLSEE